MEFIHAQTGSQGYLSIIMMVGIIAIFYFLIIRPQQKKQKQLKAQVESLGKGDRFISTGGLYATVVGIKEHVIVAKIADEVKVEIAKSAVQAVVEKGDVS